MNHPSAILQLLDGGWMILRCMAYLESDLLHRYLTSEEMEIMQGEVLLVGCLRVIAVTHVEDIVLHVLLDNKPRTTAKAQALALSDGMEPQALVLAYLLARLHLDDIARMLAQIATDIIIVVDLS